MTAPGVELATEWVTILPETAKLVKELKQFKPPPIHVKLVIDKQGNAKSVVDEKAVVKQAEKTGEKAGEAITQGVKREVKDLPKEVAQPAAKAGETMRREIIKPIQKVDQDIAKAVDPSKQQGKIRSAAQRVGQAIRDAVSKESEKAGEESGNKIARGIERAKGAVTKAERTLADARLAAANIESRVRQQEERIKSLREATARGLKTVAAEEKIYQDMRANASKHTADEIAAQERRMEAAQVAQANRQTRLNAAIESQGRLENSRTASSNRVANAVDNLGMKEAGLASALAMQADPLDENNKKMNAGTAAAGGMMASIIPLGKQLLVTSGLFTGAMGLGGGITYVLRTGNQFTDTMNRMSGVLNAGGTTMAEMDAKARELGRDFMLPATSANDAAESMFELTKAGFTAQQAMDAAKGSLQLSAAAGISAADASYITGTALNAYGLQATEAARVTDILANAANLFPGEMADFGYSLSQAGAVAKSFGIDIEDTTTALGFLAKAGIKSSDAGTLIKTMLLSLTDSGKPAQEAIRTLGLELYDQQGKFKGIEYVYNRLNQASKEMTQEQYQAATATLFGTDAARFAGLAAGESAPKWDDFRGKIDETGTAARVAEARMQGLPGSLEKLKNAGASLALTIYDAVKGPAEAVVDFVAKVVLAFDDWLNSGFIEQIKKYKEELIGVGIVLGTYVTGLAAIKIATAAWTAVQWALNAALNANPIGLIVLAIAAVVGGLIYAYKHFEGFREVVDNVGRSLKEAWVKAWPSIKVALDAIGQGLSWLWNNILVPFGQWLVGTFFPKYWGFVKTMWENVWKPVFSAIGTTIKWLWTNVFIPFGTWLITNWPKFWNVVKAVWNGVIKPAFEGIKTGASAVWEVVKFGASLVTSQWTRIKTVTQGLWAVLGPIFNWIREGINFWGEGVTWLWQTILQPAWEGIKAGFTAVWTTLSPIFDNIGKGIQTVGDIASTIASSIKTAWDGISEVFKVPLRALGGFLASIPDNIMGIDIPFIGEVHDWGQKLQGLRSGGVISGPGSGTSDSILGMSNGVPTVRVSNGEGIVPEAALATPIGRALFGMLLKLPGLRNGGVIDEAINFAQDMGDGRAYVYGGTGPGFDCSGFMSSIYAKFTGKNPNTRYFTTESDFESLGFQKGYKEGAFNVGIKRGGGGKLSHMAGTLPNGVNVESGGAHNSTMYGGAAAGAKDFPLQYYLPVGGGDPSDGASYGSSTYSRAGMGSGGGSSSGGGGGGYTGFWEVDQKKLSRAEDRVTDRTNQLETAQQRLDEQLAKQAAGETVKESTLTNARNQVEKFQRELDQAKAELEEVQRGEYKEGKKSDKGSGDSTGDDWSSVGGMIFNGFLESMGFDGSVFKNIFETPNVKSAIAGLNWGLGMLFPGEDAAEQGNGGLDLGLGGGDGGNILGAGTEMLAGIGEQAGFNFPEQAMAGAGAPGPGNGPVFDLRGSQLGVSPGAFDDKMGEMTAASKRHVTLGPN